MHMNPSSNGFYTLQIGIMSFEMNEQSLNVIELLVDLMAYQLHQFGYTSPVLFKFEHTYNSSDMNPH